MSKTIKTAVRRIALSGIATIFCAFATGSVNAEPGEQTYSKKVSYAGLNLSSQAGAEILYGRIKSAARDVCGGRDPVLRGSITRTPCYRDAVSNAVAQVNSPVLSALHSKKATRLARQ